MKITYAHPADLVPYEKNSKRHPEAQIELLARAIDEFGFDQPIVVDEDMVIIKGHGRREAALKLELDQVPIVIRKISKRDAKLLRVADNTVPSLEWDEVALHDELGELGTSGFDLSLTGFDLPVGPADLPTSTQGVALVTIETRHHCGSCGYEW